MCKSVVSYLYSELHLGLYLESEKTLVLLCTDKWQPRS